MTVRVEQSVELPVPRERVWTFISDPEKRARPISVVRDFELESDGRAIWQIKLPIPLIDRTIAVETENVTVDPPSYVKFVGRSRAMRVVGEHELAETENGTGTGTVLTNRFTVEGRVPGVERYFRRNFEGELDNLEDAIREDLGL
ncbi:polyketide cyclase [Halobacteriales archaeon QS_1_68_17]|nr:MAG: polyketide cyclase [Halobacteriales archaeon QS_1_68_17]